MSNSFGASGTIVDASTSRKGALRIAGDLDGTATAPTVKSRTRPAIVGLTEGDFKVSDYANASACIAAALLAANNILIRDGIYELTTDLKLASDKQIEGESELGTILRMNAGVNKSLITSGNPTGMLSNIVLRNMTLDQQGALQSAGGGIVIAGIKDSTFENLTLPTSFRFTTLIQHQGNVPDGTGTVSITNGSDVLTGNGTSFLADFALNDVIRVPVTISGSPANEFARVAAVISDTEIRLSRPWYFSTVTGVAYKKIIPNSNLTFRNVKWLGTLDDRDNAGFGLCDESIVENCYSANASGAGCGFVPDHARAMNFVNCVAANNANAGFSYETCEDIVTANCVSYGAKTGNGYQLISGSTRCVVSNTICYGNFQHGFAINYNNAGFPPPDQNTFNTVFAYENGGYGARIDGSGNNYFKGEFYNNNTGGIIQNTAQSRVPFNNTIESSRFYDSRSTKRQQRGVYLVSGVNTKIVNSEISTSDHTVSGITDQATNTAMLTQQNGSVGINNNQPTSRLNINTPATSDTNADLLLAAGNASRKPLVVQAAASQTANLMEFQSSAGNIFANLTSGGLWRGPTANANAPTYSFSQEGGTGMYRKAGEANALYFTVAANDKFKLSVDSAHFFRGMVYNRTAVGNTNYTVLPSDYIIAYITLTAPRTVTLPTAVGVTGQTYVIKDETGNAGTHNITIGTTSSQTIDGQSTLSISAAYGLRTLYSNGENWLTV